MATVRWIGNARAVAQINRIVPANVAVGNTFTVTINGKGLTFTATEATVANACGGLKALIDNSPEPEFKEVTATNTSTALWLTAKVPGKPFTQTSSATGGTATNTTSTTTSNAGPNDWNTAANWSGGSVPGADDVYIEFGPDILYGLDQSAVAHAGVSIAATYTGRIGLPLVNPAGYREYRGTYLQSGAASILVGYGSGPGSDHIRLNSDATAATIIVMRTAAKAYEAGAECVRWKGSNASSVMVVRSGCVGVGTEAGTDATLTTLSIGSQDGIRSPFSAAQQFATDPEVNCGFGAVVTTANLAGGQLVFDGTLTTLRQAAGRSVMNTGSTVTTIRLYGGTCVYQGAGTITNLYLYKGSKILFGRDLRSRTITNTYLIKNPADDLTGEIIDPLGTITYTNAPTRTYGSQPAQFAPG